MYRARRSDVSRRNARKFVTKSGDLKEIGAKFLPPCLLPGSELVVRNHLHRRRRSVVRVFKGLFLYFSSWAALEGNPPTKPYGLSKWIIERRIELIERAHFLRIWGCYGPGEAPTRFSAVCKTQRHVVIDQDRYFDFIDVRDVKQVVRDYIEGRNSQKNVNLIYPEKRLLSQWAEFFGATSEILEPGLAKPYCFGR